MTLDEELSKSDQKWLWHWSLWPVGLYSLGAFISIYSVIFLPLTLTLLHYFLLKAREGNGRPLLWFCLLPMYGLIFWLISSLPSQFKTVFGYSLFLVDYYLSQCIAEVILFFMFTNWRWGWYAGFNLLACSSWLVVFRANSDETIGTLWLYLVIPAIALVTNALTGYGLLKATETTGE